MISQEKIDRMLEILVEEEFANSLSKVKTEEEMKALFATKGLDVNVNDLVEFQELLSRFQEDYTELSEEELEMIVGGKVNWNKVFGVIKTILGLVGSVVGIVLPIAQVRASNAAARASQAFAQGAATQASSAVKSLGTIADALSKKNN